VKIRFLKNKSMNNNGARYKYFKLFGKLGLDVQWTPAIEGDIFVVFGDKYKDYMQAIHNRKRYILIQHDCASMRLGGQRSPEMGMINRSAGVIFTSEEHQSYYDGMRVPSVVIHLRPSVDDIYFSPDKLEGKHLVYAGGMRGYEKRTSNYGFRSYTGMLKRFMEYGWTVHYYRRGSRGDRSVRKDDNGLIVHPNVPNDMIYREMSKYTAGFQGYNKEDVPKQAYKYVQTCRPNKLWEYLGAGIPTIGFQGGSGMKLYDGKWGVVLNSLDDIPNIKLPVITPEMQREQVIENDLPKLKKFIKEIL
jgi:hypothetical protein